MDETEGRMARLSDNLDCIIDSDGQRVEYNDPRIVHIWTIGYGRLTLRMIKKVYENSGRKYRCFNATTVELMQYAKKVCSGRECVPMTAMVGAALKDIHDNREAGEISIYICLDQEGPCQNGAWPAVWETFDKRLSLKNVISGIQPNQNNKYLGLGGEHTNTTNKCILLGDLFEEAENTLKCLAVDKDSAMKTFETEFDRFLKCFSQGDKAIEPALNEWAAKMAQLPLRDSIEETPKVLIFGGLNLLFVHYPATDYFIEQGIIPKVVDFTEGSCWLESENLVRYGFKNGLVTPGEQFAASPGKGDRKEAVKARKARFGIFLIDSMHKKFRKIMEKSGLMFDEHIPFSELAEEGHKYVSYNGFTESSTTTGRYICTIKRELYDGLVNLGSFNCQPAMNSQAIIRPLANKNDMPYVAIDCEGPWISTNQKRLLETIAVQARRVRRRKNDLRSR
ncbi:MAG: hypothetical protein JRG97_07960 [Deltaproteobacteria bacterium]|nr:hypothetical protein [Deltaproteobacteria bacterium]MBW2052384.1 hypothetical protein [Deltaproteobacteria bacterium]MBW2140992.1 hypothetical protein [Deltaproteobacteria bacterium]